MTRRDLIASVVIGAGVGALSQLILTNVAGSFGLELTALFRTEVFIGFTLLAPTALFILSLLGRVIPVLYQFGKFAAVGTLNTFVDIGVLNLLIVLFGTPGTWGYRVFKSLSFIAGTTNSFLWNKFWTFEAHEPANFMQTVKFYFAAFIGFVLNVGLASYVFSSVVRPVSVSPDAWASVGALVGVAAAFFWDFLAYKFWVFKKAA